MSQYKKDMIASFFFLILGALVLISVPLTIQDPGVSVMGPRVFPYFIGACMVILSLALMLTTIVKHRKAGGADSTGTFASEEERKRALRDELRALLPPEGPVLVLGIGNRRVTADALGPRTAQKILVTMGPQHTLPVKGIRPVAAIAPGVSASTGLTLRQLAGAMVEAVRPAALICVDSLCSAEGARLGRSVQFSDTGLYPAQADHAKHLDAAALGVPVIAAGIPTLMDSDEGADLVVTPRALDSVIAHGSALLAGAINRALQPRLSVAQLFWLAG